MAFFNVSLRESKAQFYYVFWALRVKHSFLDFAAFEIFQTVEWIVK